MLPITGTFLDEISHDIPHQNWGKSEWAKDFAYMAQMGIDTVILIRCGYKRWITYPSRVLEKSENCFTPPIDLVDTYLKLAEQHQMKFYFGIYDSGKYWTKGDYEKEINLNLSVIDEVWKVYGHYPAFGGWYLSQEISRRTGKIIELYRKMGIHAKKVSGELPVLISPYIDGKKAVLAKSSTLTKSEAISLSRHEKEWNEILSSIQGAVDILAFQDGHVDYHELRDFFEVNKYLADAYGMDCWTNAESFDRDMPIKFLPIKWEKLLLKLNAAKSAGLSKAITFEFSHFMSPQSSYLQSRHLYNRYMEALNQR